MMLHSLLSTNECIKKLRAAIDESYWYGSHSIIGTIQQNKFNLRRRHSYQNVSTLPVFVFHGTLREDSTGTAIEGHFGVNLMMKAVLAIWIIFAIPFSYAIGAYFHFVIFTLVMVGIIGFAQFQGSRDKKYLQEFIERTLSARRVITGKVEL